MAGSFENYLESAVLNHIFDQAPFTIPVLHVALFKTGMVEFPAVDGYARVQTDSDDWVLSDVGMIKNFNAIIFPMAEDHWATATHWGLFDAMSAGNLLIYGTLTPEVSILFADIAKFDPYTLIVTLD